MSSEYKDNKIPLNGAQYTTMDFPTYFDELLKLVKAEYGDVYDDFASTSVGVMFIHVFAYGLSQLSWSVDRRASANFYETAESRAELARLCRRIGRKLRSGVPSSSDLTVTCDALTGPVTMNKGFKFQGPGDLVFENTADMFLPVGTTSFTPFVSEGESKEIKYTGTGLPNQSYEIPGTDELNGYWVAQDSVNVFVNGVLWVENEFFTLDKTDQFEVHYLEDPVELFFGDGVVGNIPATGADITIRYNLTHGSRGNVNKNQITSAIDELTVLGDTVSLTVTNEKNTSGGLDPEDIEFARKVAPQLFAAHESAVTETDYQALINTFQDPTYGAIAKGYAVTSRETAADSISAGILDSIDSVTNSMQSSIEADCSSSMTQLNEITESLLEITGALETITESVEDIDEKIEEIIVIQDALLVETNKLIALRSSMLSNLLFLNNLIDGSSATTAEKSGMHVYTDALEVNANNLQTYAQNITAYVNEITGGLSYLMVESQNIATSVPLIETEVNSISGNVTIITTDYEHTKAVAISTNSSVDAYSIQLISHLDEVLSADCTSNIVNVAALTTDVDGFYADPSTGLLVALETYLMERKEVTQYVQVVSGVAHLLPADISVTGRVLPTYIKSQVESDISRVIDDLLKNREFAARLNIDDLYKAVENISGIDYINIEITAPVSRLDAKGNLVPQNLEIITKGTVTITMSY